ncbi:MAG: type II toxin-antitoxin system VapC family toxin [Deltaproteobacteria bacterium]
MKLLLDTHALIWWATLHRQLSAKAKRALSDQESQVYVSAASAWEIAIKARIGKLDWPAEAGSVNDYVLGQGFRALPISLDHAERAGQLAIQHRDPFDRMLIAQALAENLLLVSNESVFDGAGVRRYW